MPIFIKEVHDKKSWNDFIYLPEIIHKNHENWVPPLYIDEKKFFSKDRNPAFGKNETRLLVAYENNKPVGRIMGIIPTAFNEANKLRTARFSYFECYERKEIFDLLLSEVETWAKSKKCNQLIGPMGFSDKEPQGFVTKGFDEPTMLVTNCSFRFMKEYIEENDYRPYVELCQYDLPISSAIIERYQKFAHRVERNHQITVNEFTNTKSIKPFIKPVFELINRIYTEIYGFTEVTEAEMEEFAHRFLPLLNPQLIKIITNAEGKVIAFVIAMPDMSKGIKKAKGRLFPFGWLPIVIEAKTSKKLMLLLGGVDNEMQNKGLDALLAIKLFHSALLLGFKTMDSHLIMKDNVKMRREIERLENSRLYKEYAIYRKDL